MTVYTTLPEDDQNLDVVLTEDSDLVTLNIQPAAVSITGAVNSVNGQTGDVVLTTTQIPEGTNEYYTDGKVDARVDLQTGANLDLSFADTDDLAEGPTNFYYTDARVDAHLTGGTGVTYTAGDISIGQPVGTGDDVEFNSVTGDMFGVQHFTAKARETIGAGQPVYISGHSGNTPEVMLADYADPAKMPAFGIASADINNNNNGAIATAGDLKNVDTTGTSSGETWSVGDNLYVNGSKLTNVRPGSETQFVQSLAKVIRVHQNVGQMFLSGAGRVNDIPNLTNKHVFIGDTVAPERRQLTYTDILNTPDLTPYATQTYVNALPVSTFTNDAGYLTTETDSQTLSFANPDLTISNGNTVDLSALTPTSLAWSAITSTPTTIAGYGITDAFSGSYTDLTNKPSLTDLQDVTTIAPDSGGMTITNAGVTTFEFGSDAKLQWRSQSDGGEINNWAFDNTGQDIFTGMHWRTGANKKLFRIEALSPGGTDPGDNSYTTGFVISGSDNTFKSRQHNESTAPLSIDADGINLLTNGSNVKISGSYDLPNADGTVDQVLTTDGNGTAYWASGGGGGASALGDLSDVEILNLQNNDILIYNGTASEWQNTNLGVSVTPTLSGNAEVTAGSPYTITVTNHATYDDPNYFVEVYEGTTLITTNDNVTDNHDGTLTFNTDQTPANLQARVKVQDFGDLQSEIATLDFEATAFGGTYRYFRIDNITGATSNNIGLRDVRFYASAGQTGTAYPSNMTSETTPTPFVVTKSYEYNNTTYAAWKAFDSGSAWWWLLSSSNVQNEYLQIDMGAQTAISSMKIGDWWNQSPTSVDISASTTGAFAGEEVLLTTVFFNNGPATTVLNIG